MSGIIGFCYSPAAQVNDNNFVSMHVLISCIGSASDVYPFIAIGQILRSRGHRVDLLSSPYFRDRVESAGLAFIPIGTLEDYQHAVADADLWHPRRSFP